MKEDSSIAPLSEAGAVFWGSRRRAWVVTIVLLVVLAIPLGQAAVTYSPTDVGKGQATDAAVSSVENLTVVTSQGTELGSGDGVFIFNENEELVYSYTDIEKKPFDVDVFEDNSSRLLFTAQRYPYGTDERYPWQAVVLDWRNDTIVKTFPVPPITHDVDRVGEDEYVVASLASRDHDHYADFLRVIKDRGWVGEDRENFTHNAYVVDLSTDEITFEYRFKERYPESAGEGPTVGYTHLNDVDVVENGSALLTSPRNFDRVVLIDKATKEKIWTLGEEDNYEILNEQHNPVLLETNPPTVLVADSGNHRVVEYVRQSDGTWKADWTYDSNDVQSGMLHWPRDADRLPNGNTLIVATANSFVAEVTPEKEVVWKVTGLLKVYDAERMAYADEPRGPTMREIRGETAVDDADTDSEQGFVSRLKRPLVDYYNLSKWVLPPWVTGSHFAIMHAMVAIALAQMRLEVRTFRQSE